MLCRSEALPPSLRTERAASIRGFSASALRNVIASNRFDLPTPLRPAIQVKGPKDTSTSTRFLKPLTFKRVSIGRAPQGFITTSGYNEPAAEAMPGRLLAPWRMQGSRAGRVARRRLRPRQTHQEGVPMSLIDFAKNVGRHLGLGDHEQHQQAQAQPGAPQAAQPPAAQANQADQDRQKASA